MSCMQNSGNQVDTYYSLKVFLRHFKLRQDVVLGFTATSTGAGWADRKLSKYRYRSSVPHAVSVTLL